MSNKDRDEKLRALLAAVDELLRLKDDPSTSGAHMAVAWWSLKLAREAL